MLRFVSLLQLINIKHQTATLTIPLRSEQPRLLNPLESEQNRTDDIAQRQNETIADCLQQIRCILIQHAVFKPEVRKPQIDQIR